MFLGQAPWVYTPRLSPVDAARLPIPRTPRFPLFAHAIAAFCNAICNPFSMRTVQMALPAKLLTAYSQATYAASERRGAPLAHRVRRIRVRRKVQFFSSPTKGVSHVGLNTEVSGKNSHRREHHNHG